MVHNAAGELAHRFHAYRGLERTWLRMVSRLQLSDDEIADAVYEARPNNQLTVWKRRRNDAVVRR